MASRLWTLDVLWYVCASLLIIGVVSLLLGTVPYVKHRFIKLRNKADYVKLKRNLDNLPLHRVMVLRRDTTYTIHGYTMNIKRYNGKLRLLKAELRENLNDQYILKYLTFKRGTRELKAQYRAVMLRNTSRKIKIIKMKSLLLTTKLNLRVNKSFKANLTKYLKERIELNTIHE